MEFAPAQCGCISEIFPRNRMHGMSPADGSILSISSYCCSCSVFSVLNKCLGFGVKWSGVHWSYLWAVLSVASVASVPLASDRRWLPAGSWKFDTPFAAPTNPDAIRDALPTLGWHFPINFALATAQRWVPRKYSYSTAAGCQSEPCNVIREHDRRGLIPHPRPYPRQRLASKIINAINGNRNICAGHSKIPSPPTTPLNNIQTSSPEEGGENYKSWLQAPATVAHKCD